AQRSAPVANGDERKTVLLSVERRDRTMPVDPKHLVGNRAEAGSQRHVLEETEYIDAQARFVHQVRIEHMGPAHHIAPARLVRGYGGVGVLGAERQTRKGHAARVPFRIAVVETVLIGLLKIDSEISLVAVEGVPGGEVNGVAIRWHGIILRKVCR